MSRSTKACLAIAALFLGWLAAPAIAASPQEDEWQSAESPSPNRALRGHFATAGGLFFCVNADPGALDPDELRGDAAFDLTATKVEFTFDGHGNLSYVNDQNLVLSATDLLAGQDPIGTVGGATVLGSGTYEMQPDRRNFAFEYTIFIDFGAAGSITSTPIRGHGLLSRDRQTVSLGITEPQVRTVFFNESAFFDQVCTWSVTAIR